MDPAQRLGLRHHLRGLAEPVVARHACELVAVELTNEGGQEIVRLYIDSPGRVTVGECQQISHAVSALLDVNDPFPSGYRLEVSSPGMDRPVESRADLLRFTGFRARVRLLPRAGRRRFAGRLAGIEGDDLVVEVEGERRRFPLDDVDRVRLVLDPEEYDRLGREGLPPVPADPALAPASPSPDGSPALPPTGGDHV